MKTTYQPIDCNFYDILEANATLKKDIEIIYENIEGVTVKVNTVIKDLFTKNKEEFIVFENGVTIRMDYLISVDGQELSGLSC